MGKINVVGLGYIGLPTALMLASRRLEVVGTDKNQELVAALQAGEITSEEKGLAELYQEARRNGIEFSTELIPTAVYIVAVPTPYNKVSKKIDTHYLIAAVSEILMVCPSGAIIVIESTVSPGTIDRHLRPLLTAKGLGSGEVHLVHAPERIIPGNMLEELIHNPRTIGADEESLGQKVKDIYAAFCQGSIIVTDIRTAEMSKVVENTFRDVNIAFANELAKICRADNLNVYEIIRIANMHPRVNILQPGPGVGGHCLSVDPWFLVGDYPGLAKIVFTARTINDSMPGFVLSRIRKIMREQNIWNPNRIGLYGLTYKENTADTRESPALQLLEAMALHLAPGLKAYDPFVKHDLTVNQYHDLDLFLNAIDLVVIMVAHDEIRQNAGKLLGKIVLDTRNFPEAALLNPYRL